MTDAIREDVPREDTYVPSQTVGVNPWHTRETATPWWVASAWGNASLAWFQKVPFIHQPRIERALAISLRRIRCMHIPGALPAASWLVDLYTHYDDEVQGRFFTGVPWKNWNHFPESSLAVRLYRFYEYGGTDSKTPLNPVETIQDRMEMLLTTAVLTREDMQTLGLSEGHGGPHSRRLLHRTPNLRRALLRNPSFPLVPGRAGSLSPFERFAKDALAQYRKNLDVPHSHGRHSNAPNPSELESMLSNPNTPHRVLSLIQDALKAADENYPATTVAGKSYLLTHPNWDSGEDGDLTLDAVGMARATFGRVYPAVDFTEVEGYRTNPFTDEDGALDMEKMFTPLGDTINAVGHFPATVKLLLDTDQDAVFEGFRGLFAEATKDQSRNLDVAQFVARHYPMLVGSAFDKQAEMYGVSSEDIPAEWLLELM